MWDFIIINRKDNMTKSIKIKAGDLRPWFLQDHDTLPQWYLDDTKKFFEWLSGRVGPKATSSQAKKNVDRQQAT